ncbi:Prion-inhibition and propagation domain containing protein [Naviculisporaceae sp. PSN 640]
MEAAGLALGVAGLAGLFSTCLECYQLVLRGSTMHKDAAILMTKFENQELRLTAWGRACGLFGPEEYDARLDDPNLSVRLAATLSCIKSLFRDEKELSARYGLRPGPLSSPANAITAAEHTAAPGELQLGGEEGLRLPTNWPLGSFFRSKRQRQRFPLLNKAHWAITDREKFTELIQHLKDFNDDLEAMTRATDVPRRQRMVVEYEIEEVEDIEVLEEIAMATSEDEGDVVSDTASVRLERIREGSVRTHGIRDNTSASDEDLSGASRTSTVPPILEQSPDSRSSSGPIPARTQRPTPTAASDDTVRVPKIKLKCVALGDSGAHITELLTVFTLGYFPTSYNPTDFKNYVTDVRCDGRDIELALWDLSGQQDYPQLRKASYDKTDVVLICCDPNQPEGEIAQSVSGWAEEVTTVCPRAPIILVSIVFEDVDSRLWLAANLKKGPKLKIQAAAEQAGGKVMANLLCNVLSGEGVDDVFEAATRAALKSTGVSLPVRRPTRGTRRRPNFAGVLSGLRRINEEDRDEK